MDHAFPEMLARSAARQVYRLLRISAPLLRPIYQHIGLEHRARAVTALVRIGWNGAALTTPLAAVGRLMRDRLATLGLLDQRGGA